MLDKAKIAYELIPYEVDENDLSAVHVDVYKRQAQSHVVTSFQQEMSDTGTYFQTGAGCDTIIEFIPVSYTHLPRGVYTEQARYFSGKALFLDTPEPRLDQSSTYKAIQELQMFMEYFPTSSRRQDAQQMIFDLQDKLVMKDYLAAKLYYDCLLYTSRCV